MVAIFYQFILYWYFIFHIYNGLFLFKMNLL